MILKKQAPVITVLKQTLNFFFSSPTTILKNGWSFPLYVFPLCIAHSNLWTSRTMYLQRRTVLTSTRTISAFRCSKELSHFNIIAEQFQWAIYNQWGNLKANVFAKAAAVL